MPQRIHPPAKTREQIQSMFAAIAPRYDLLNRVLSAGMDRGWRRKAVDAVLEGMSPSRPARILDVCCGTGDLARAFERDPRVERVIGMDFVASMVTRAKAKAGQARLSWAVADALALPVIPRTFDVVSVAFGLRNLVDPAAGLREMAGMLKPGGRLVVLEFFRPDRGVLSGAFRWYFRHVLPRVGRLFSGTRAVDAYQYLPESVEHFATPATVCSWMEQAGLAQPSIHPLTLGAVSLVIGHSSPPDAAARDGEATTSGHETRHEAPSDRASRFTSHWESVSCSTS